MNNKICAIFCYLVHPVHQNSLGCQGSLAIHLFPEFQLDLKILAIQEIQL